MLPPAVLDCVHIPHALARNKVTNAKADQKCENILDCLIKRFYIYLSDHFSSIVHIIVRKIYSGVGNFKWSSGNLKEEAKKKGFLDTMLLPLLLPPSVVRLPCVAFAYAKPTLLRKTTNINNKR